MRIKKFSAAFIFLMLNTVLLFGQGEPCGGADPDSSACPLDTWVMVLAGVVFIFTVIHLLRKQKAGAA